MAFSYHFELGKYNTKWQASLAYQYIRNGAYCRRHLLDLDSGLDTLFTAQLGISQQ